METNAEILRFVRLLCTRRAMRSTEHELRRVSLSSMLSEATIGRHGVILNQPNWSDDSLSVALGGELRSERLLFHLIMNAYWQPLEFELPASPGSWRRWIDTSLESPDEIAVWEEAPLVPTNNYPVAARSVVMIYQQVSK